MRAVSRVVLVLDSVNALRLQGVALRPLTVSLSKVLWALAILVQFFAAIDYFAVLAKKAADLPRLTSGSARADGWCQLA